MDMICYFHVRGVAFTDCGVLEIFIGGKWIILAIIKVSECMRGK